jgi:hypothetical protein
MALKLSDCERLNIKKNTLIQSREKLDSDIAQTSTDYLQTCLPPDQQASARLEATSPAIAAANSEAEQLVFMNEFLLGLLAKETGTDQTLIDLAGIAEKEMETLQARSEDLKAEIRTKRRIFLDSEPQKSPAVGGLYYTKVPDNQVLIAFLSTFGAFLLFIGLLIILNHMPIAYFETMGQSERYTTVAIMWVAGIVIMYAGLYMFT